VVTPGTQGSFQSIGDRESCDEQSGNFEDIIYEVRGRAAWIIINRPKLYNAFRARTIEELITAFKTAADDRGVSSIVLTGAGERPSAPAVTRARMRGSTMVEASLDCRLMNFSRSFAMFPSRS